MNQQHISPSHHLNSIYLFPTPPLLKQQLYLLQRILHVYPTEVNTHLMRYSVSYRNSILFAFLLNFKRLINQMPFACRLKSVRNIKSLLLDESTRQISKNMRRKYESRCHFIHHPAKYFLFFLDISIRSPLLFQLQLNQYTSYNLQVAAATEMKNLICS